MEAMPAFYTIKDSLGNFRIKVRLERVHAAGGTAAPSLTAFLRHQSAVAGLGEEGPELPRRNHQRLEDGDRETEEYTFKWQEKVFSQREFLLYASEANCENVLQRQYHHDVLHLRESGGRPTSRIFSRTENDEPALENRIENMVIGDSKPSFLVEKMATVRHRRVAPRPQWRSGIYQDPVVEMPTAEAKRKTHTLPQQKQTFRVMADLGPREATAPDPKDEHVLCTIRVFNDTLLSVEPDFNYQTKPAYRIKSRLGDFQFTLEHASAKFTMEDLEAEKKADVSFFDYRPSTIDALAGAGFDVPEEGVLKVFYLGEILSARSFEYDHLFIHYFVELPRGWYCSSGNSALWGTTLTCRTANVDKDEVAYFSCPFELELCCNTSHYEAESAARFPKWPQMFLEVLSRDSWNRYRTEGYAYQTLPMAPEPTGGFMYSWFKQDIYVVNDAGVSEDLINTWRPLHGGTQAELRRFFLGGLEELDELDFTRIPKSFEGNKLSRFGFQTRSSGSVAIRFYTAFQSRQLVATERHKQLRYGALMEKIGASVGMHSSIISVLEAFQRARQRMIAVRDNIYAEQGLYPA